MKVWKRIAITMVTLCCLVIGIYIYSRYIEPSFLVVKTREKAVPAEVKESKIVFFCDTHFGEYYEVEQLERIVDKINAQSPDLVIFGGDFFDNYARDKKEMDLSYISKQLNRIEAKNGKFSIYGNHDQGGGAWRTYKQVMEEGGFTMLKNTSKRIDALNITLLGLDDHLLGQVDESLYRVPEDSFYLVLTHEPDVADHLTMKGNNMIVAGHSHGGQVSIPFVTDKILPYGAKKYVDGVYQVDSQTVGKETQLFVSTGIGMTKIPLRFLNPPEIVVINLIPEK